MQSCMDFIGTLRSHPDYPKHQARFDDYVRDADRDPKKKIDYFLVYDLDTGQYTIFSEYKITYNHIVLRMAQVPPRGKEEVKIKEYEFPFPL